MFPVGFSCFNIDPTAGMCSSFEALLMQKASKGKRSMPRPFPYLLRSSSSTTVGADQGSYHVTGSSFWSIPELL